MRKTLIEGGYLIMLVVCGSLSKTIHEIANGRWIPLCPKREGTPDPDRMIRCVASKWVGQSEPPPANGCVRLIPDKLLVRNQWEDMSSFWILITSAEN